MSFRKENELNENELLRLVHTLQLGKIKTANTTTSLLFWQNVYPPWASLANGYANVLLVMIKYDK